jgi:hypothetical protein
VAFLVNQLICDVSMEIASKCKKITDLMKPRIIIIKDENQK